MTTLANNLIIYSREEKLSVEEFIEVLVNSSLAERRPLQDATRMQQMISNSNLIITAGLDNQLIGIARSITDFVYCTYLSDLAVDQQFQHQGIGKELIRYTKLTAPQTKIILLAAPAAINYYPKIGMQKHEHCF